MPSPIGSTSWYITGIGHRKDELVESKWIQGLYNVLPDEHVFTHIICLGLGSLTESINPRYQLALLLLLMEHFAISPVNVVLWDPKFSAQDVEILSTFNLSVEEISSCDSIFPASTCLWYVPHGPVSLNIQLLIEPKVSWLLANDMFEYEPRTSVTDEQLAALSSYKSQKNASNHKTIPISKSDRWFTAFNDTALQHIDRP